MESTELYTDEDLDMFIQLESEHRKSIPNYSIYELLELFPTAKSKAKKSIFTKIKAIKVKINELDGYREQYINNIINKVDDIVDQQIMRDDLNKNITEKYDKYNTEINIAKSQISYIDKELKKEKLNKLLKSKKTPEVKKIETQKLLEVINKVDLNKLTGMDILRAKQVSIRNFIKVDRANKALCIFHNERTPSMHVYGSNKFNCFSCGKSGSVVDIVMQQNNCTFKEAIKKLL